VIYFVWVYHIFWDSYYSFN